MAVLILFAVSYAAQGCLFSCFAVGDWHYRRDLALLWIVGAAAAFAIALVLVATALDVRAVPLPQIPRFLA